MSGLFSPKAPKANKPTPVNGLEVQTSSYGLPIALRYGRNRAAGQVIDYVGFRAVEHAQKQKSGGKGAPKPPTTYSYTYNVTFLLALGEGQMSAINRVWKDKDVMTLTAAGLTFFNGSAGQAAWSYMVSKHPTRALGYANTSYVGGPDIDLGGSAALPNYNFDISGLLYLSGKEGAAPKDILVDYLTHAQHGAGFNFLGTLTTFDTYCKARNLYLSPFEDSQRPAGNFVKEIAETCNAAIVWGQGKLNLVPYGDEQIVGTDATYTPDLTPLFALSPDDFAKGSQNDAGAYISIERKPLERAYNHVRLEVRDKDRDYITTVVEAKDQADIDLRGLRSKAVMKMEHITHPLIGRDIAQMILQRELYVRRTFTFRLTIRHMLLDLMDYVSLTDPAAGLSLTLARVIAVTEENDGLSVECEEVLASASSAPLYTTQNSEGFLPDFNVSPGSVNAPLLINAPPTLCTTGYELWIAADAASQNWGGCQVWMSYDNLEYKYVGNMSGRSRIGTLNATVPAGAALDLSSTVDVTLGAGEMFSGTDDDRDNFRTLGYLQSNGGEFFAYKTATLTGALRYALTSLARGAFGTGANSHASGTKYARIDETLFRLPYDPADNGKTVYVKLMSFNIYGSAQQSLADATAYSVVLRPNAFTPLVTQTDITNPGFESDLDEWEDAYGTGTTGWYTQAPGFGGSTRELVKYLGANGNSGWINKARIPVVPGERYAVAAMVKTNFANGVVYGGIGFAYYNNANVLVGQDWQVNDYSGTTYVNDTYTKMRKVVTVPAGAAYARFALNVRSYAGVGAFVFDNCEFSRVTSNLDEVPDGAAYARMFGNYLQGGAPFSLSFGDNMVQNPRFEDVTFNAGIGTHVPGTNMVPGWESHNFFGDMVGGVVGNGEFDGSAYVLYLTNNGGSSIAAGGNVTGNVVTKARYPVTPGDRYIATARMLVGKLNTVPANVAVEISIGAHFYNSAGAVFTAIYNSRITQDYDSRTRQEPDTCPITVPAGAAYMAYSVRVRILNNTAGSYVTAATLVGARIDDISLRKVNLASAGAGNLLRNTDATNGTNFWTGLSSVFENPSEANQFRVNSLADGAFAFPYQDVAGGYDTGSYVTFSGAAILIGGTLGLGSRYQPYVEFYNGATLLTTVYGTSLLPGTAVDLSFTKFAVTGQIPVNTTKVRAGFVIEGPQTLFAFIQPKLEKGPYATTYMTGADGTFSQGLVFAGSNRRIGDQRNLPQSLATAYGSVRTVGALTANSSGQVTVNAHTVRYGATSVSYSAVSNAVTGLTVGVTYIIYCTDTDYTGGTKTWSAGTVVADVMNIGDNIVIAGQVTIPSSGSAGGGGAGSCVVMDMELPDGGLAGGVEAGDMLHCWNDDAENPGIEFVTVESNELVPNQPCRTIITVSGASVAASESTPMTLRDGTITYIPDMFGRDALVRYGDGSLVWERVAFVSEVEYRTVAKIKVHQRCYFAGYEADATIATHNPIAKP